MIYFWVGTAGAAGAILRYWIGFSLFTNSSFPFPTLCVNLIGSFLLAWLSTNVFQRLSLSPVMRTAIGTGFIGSFTTFSAVSVETVTMFQSGKLILPAIYVFISMTGGLLMSRIGFRVSKEARRL